MFFLIEKLYLNGVTPIGDFLNINENGTIRSRIDFIERIDFSHVPN